MTFRSHEKHGFTSAFTRHLTNKPPCTDPDPILQEMRPPPLDHLTNVHDFISTPARPIITKLGILIDQYAMTLPYN